MPNNDNLNDNQYLSDLLDGYVSNKSIDKLLSDPKSAHVWYRYNRVSDVLKQQLSVHSSFEFTQSISAKIAQEPAILSVKEASPEIISMPLFKRAFTGFAIAASVAFVTVFSVQINNSQDASSSFSTLADQKVNNLESNLSERAIQEQARLDKIQKVLDNLDRNSLNVNEVPVTHQEIRTESYLVEKALPASVDVNSSKSVKSESEKKETVSEDENSKDKEDNLIEK